VRINLRLIFLFGGFFLGKSTRGKTARTDLTRFISVVLFLLAAVLVFPSGKKDERDLLAEARALFEEKKYDETRKVLAEIIRTDRENFDAVDEIMEKIREVEIQINLKYEELETALFDERDEDKALGILDELMVLNPYPNEKDREWLDMLRLGAANVTKFRDFDEIMDAALEKLLVNDYTGAVFWKPIY
jgi:tetratricopeptide (TPR) repeat protein